MSTDARKEFAAALWDVPANEAFVLLASTKSAHALVREAPPLDALPEIITPWIRARAWATAHRDAPVAAPLSLVEVEKEIAAAQARGLVLVEPFAPTAFVSSGALAHAFVFAPRGRKTKLRLDRVQHAFVRANGRWLGERSATTIVDAALTALDPSPLPFKEVLRRARESVSASSDDAKQVARALLRAWKDSDVELYVRQTRPTL